MPAELLDVVGGGAEEVDGLEVRHRLLGIGGVVNRLDEEHLLPQQIRLAVHHAHHPDLEEAGGQGSGQIGTEKQTELGFSRGGARTVSGSRTRTFIPGMSWSMRSM